MSRVVATTLKPKDRIKKTIGLVRSTKPDGAVELWQRTKSAVKNSSRKLMRGEDLDENESKESEEQGVESRWRRVLRRTKEVKRGIFKVVRNRFNRKKQ